MTRNIKGNVYKWRYVHFSGYRNFKDGSFLRYRNFKPVPPLRNSGRTITSVPANRRKPWTHGSDSTTIDPVSGLEETRVRRYERGGAAMADWLAFTNHNDNGPIKKLSSRRLLATNGTDGPRLTAVDSRRRFSRILLSRPPRRPARPLSLHLMNIFTSQSEKYETKMLTDDWGNAFLL